LGRDLRPSHSAVTALRAGGGPGSPVPCAAAAARSPIDHDLRPPVVAVTRSV